MAPELQNRGHFTSERLEGAAPYQVDAFVVLVQPSSPQTMCDRAPAETGIRELLSDGESLLDIGDARDLPVTAPNHVL
jgi:hypothetical protein